MSRRFGQLPRLAGAMVALALVVAACGADADEQVVPTGRCGWSAGLSQAGASPGAVEADDQLGASLSMGDFNGDGELDLAVGVPGENDGAGAVSVFYAPCASGTDQVFTQATAGVPGASESGDGFGTAILASDLNGDGFGDLVIGIPGEDISGRIDAGSIVILSGSPDGLTTTDARALSQFGPVAGAGEAGDRFGASLAVGDFNDDGPQELVIGSPGETADGQANAGAVTVLPGGPGGPSAAGSITFGQAGPISGSAEDGDGFGSSLASADFDGDGYDELIVGVPGEGLFGDEGAGAFHVIPGTPNGLDRTADRMIHQATPSVRGAAEAGDHFAASLAVGDVNGDGYADLAVGVPDEDVGGRADAGAVNLFVGGVDGVTGGSIVSSGQLQGDIAAGDRFGLAVAIVDLGGDPHDDLVVGVPGADLGSSTDAGAVYVLPGRAGGVDVDAALVATQATGTIAGKLESGDRFGTSLAAGRDVLFAGAPGEAIGQAAGDAAGAVMPIGLADVDPPPPPSTEAMVTFSFDDGRKAHATVAGPALESRGFRGTFYLTTGFLDGGLSVSSQDVIDLHAAGHEIGGHTVTHPRLTELDAAALQQELTASKAILEGLIGEPVDNFATPYGLFDAEVAAAVEAVYGSHRTVAAGLNHADGTDRYTLEVRNVYRTTTTSTVDAWMAEAEAQGAWLILLYHDLIAEPAIWDTTPEALASHLDAAVDRDLTVVTVAEGLAILEPDD